MDADSASNDKTSQTFVFPGNITVKQFNTVGQRFVIRIIPIKNIDILQCASFDFYNMFRDNRTKRLYKNDDKILVIR